MQAEVGPESTLPLFSYMQGSSNAVKSVTEVMSPISRGALTTWSPGNSAATLVSTQALRIQILDISSMLGSTFKLWWKGSIRTRGLLNWGHTFLIYGRKQSPQLLCAQGNFARARFLSSSRELKSGENRARTSTRGCTRGCSEDGRNLERKQKLS